MLETAILVEFWATILHRVNTTSKSLQDPSIDIEKSILLHRSLIHFFEKMRNDHTFDTFEEKGRNLISDNRCGSNDNINLTYNCFNKRGRKRNPRYDVGDGPETVIEGRDKYRVECFYTALDSIMTQLRSSTKSYEEVMKPFSFLLSLDSQTLSDDELRRGCEHLQSIYCSDLDDGEQYLFAAFKLLFSKIGTFTLVIFRITGLYDECQQFKFFMEDISSEIRDEERFLQSKVDGDEDDDENEYRTKSKMISKSSRMLQYIIKTKITASFTNICAALRIFETIAISNCSGERSFSMLKRVKSDLRSAQTQDYLNDLSMLYANNDILKNLNCDKIIHLFSQAKARRKTFQIDYVKDNQKI